MVLWGRKGRRGLKGGYRQGAVSTRSQGPLFAKIKTEERKRRYMAQANFYVLSRFTESILKKQSNTCSLPKAIRGSEAIS